MAYQIGIEYRDAVEVVTLPAQCETQDLEDLLCALFFGDEELRLGVTPVGVLVKGDDVLLSLQTFCRGVALVAQLPQPLRLAVRYPDETGLAASAKSDDDDDDEDDAALAPPTQSAAQGE